MIRVAAPAKVNLHLHVVGRRTDGYHLLDSLIVFADIADEIAVTAAETLSLAIDGPFAPALAAESDNLVLRAARLLAEAHGRAPGARIRLTKRLPVSAGLGGGSADAAAALRALSRLWSVEIPGDLPIRLGADVPACLLGRPLLLAGAGEILRPAPPLPSAFLLLVNPGVAVATPDVFRARSGAFSAPAPLDAAPADARELAAMLRERGNDLSDPAIALAPAIGEALERVAATAGCLLARMSGSGASVFGLYAAAAEAGAAAAAIAGQRPTWWRWSGAIRRGDAPPAITTATD